MLFRQFGLGEILFILFIVILIFGVGRITKIAGELGTSIRAFKDGLSGKDEDETAASEDTSDDNDIPNPS